MSTTQQKKIRKLPKLLVDQIAAGEVVERPAAVVRELLDNAIDAGARRIEVEIEQGGRTLLRVSDDGAGIAFDELSLAFASHATSKLSALDDLTHIATLGFRGEALASIGAVSRARIRSRAEGAAHAGEITNEGGVVSVPAPAARARGTDVEARDLFYNVPARRRFLRKDSTESGHAVDAVVRQALANPEIAFRVAVDGKLVFELDAPPQRDARATRLDRIRKAFGAEVANDLRPIEAAGAAFSVDGFLGSSASARNNSSGTHLFVNGRWVSDRGLARVVRDATHDVLGSRQPFVFLFVVLDPALVDVNVHPAKLEVRFREPGAVYGAIHRAIRGVYERERPVAGAELLQPLAGGARAAEWLHSHGVAPAYAASPELLPSAGPPGLAARDATNNPGAGVLFPGAAAAPARASRFLRAFATFLVVESDEGIDLIDQHALHERVQFEALRAQAAAGGVARQTLLIPELLELTPGEMGLAEEHADLWLSAGVDTSAAGPTTLAVRSVPAALRRTNARSLISELLVWAREKRRPTAGSVLEEVLHRCACHASVRAGDQLTDGEIESLLARAAALPADQTCPHGRPTRIRLTLRDLERAFDRR